MTVIRNFPAIARHVKGIQAAAIVTKTDPDIKDYETKGLNALTLAVIHNYPSMVPVLMNYSPSEILAYEEGTTLQEESTPSWPSLRSALETRSPGQNLTPLQMALVLRRHSLDSGVNGEATVYDDIRTPLDATLQLSS
eukprot:GILJ01019466.1.p1 GENE.GILJ01019466.1~~GILJ01019466.1.p1  ORF type:complete len:156 (+),score=14.97 GILJ01019466.1:55-468(+)